MSDLNLVKELREKTGAGFLDCKNAIKESNNDINLSIDSLRKKGLSKANKKSSREANEGVVSLTTKEAAMFPFLGELIIPIIPFPPLFVTL